MKKIVVVEDQQVLATIYRTKLAAEGFQVDVAVDGEQGLDLIKRTQPDLVLLDLMMPKLNGIEVLKKLRSIPSFQTLPILVFSSSGGSSRTDEAWQAGATMVLSKSNHSPKQLIESVRKSLAVADELQSSAVVSISSSERVAESGQLTDGERVKGHVLLVEDHEDMRALLAFILDRAGHRVSSVESQAAALRRARLEKFDLVLLSRINSEGSGLSLCKQFREVHPDTSVLIYSTAALLSEQREGLQSGASAYLTKAEDLFNIGRLASDLIDKHREHRVGESEAA
jgi:two-component system cell cycle response regulator